jgi:hypothetical protein
VERSIERIPDDGRPCSTPSRPALRAAAFDGCPDAGSDASATGEPAALSQQLRSKRDEPRPCPLIVQSTGS